MRIKECLGNFVLEMTLQDIEFPSNEFLPRHITISNKRNRCLWITPCLSRAGTNGNKRTPKKGNENPKAQSKRIDWMEMACWREKMAMCAVWRCRNLRAAGDSWMGRNVSEVGSGKIKNLYENLRFFRVPQRTTSVATRREGSAIIPHRVRCKP